MYFIYYIVNTDYEILSIITEICLEENTEQNNNV